MRLNLSKSGIGVSTGVRGARISTGPRGTYITLGTHGIYYRQKLSPAPSPTPHVKMPTNQSELEFHEIATASADALMDSSASDLLKEMNKTYRKISWSKVTLYTGICAFFIGLAQPVILLISWLLIISALPLFFVDKKRKKIRLYYDFEDNKSSLYETILVGLQALKGCSSVWKIDAAAMTTDRKRHAGASTILKRTQVRVVQKVPFIESNVQIQGIKVGKQVVCFAPDHVFVFEKRKVGAVSYHDLQVNVSSTRFIEEGRIPKDGRQVDSTWRYVNKNGTPDKRFSNNKQLPVMRYGELTLTSSTGMRMLFQTSNPEAPTQLSQAVFLMAQDVPMNTTETPPSRPAEEVVSIPTDTTVSQRTEVNKELFYDEASLILQEYSHLRTPDSITNALHELSNRRSQSHDTQYASITFEFHTTASRLVRDSKRYASHSGHGCAEVELETYYTTFDSLTDSQRQWYFYWRDRVLHGDYVPTSLSYLVLFTYELMNYSFNENAAFNVSMMVRLYDQFKEAIPQCRSYLPRWTADMLWELEEGELARKWDAVHLPNNQVNFEEQLLSQHNHFDKVSISVWKPFLPKRETDFLVDHRHRVYNVFKQGIRLLAQVYTEQGDDPLDLWIADDQLTQPRYLFAGAVIARNHVTVNTTYDVRTASTLLKQQLPQLYRFAENLLREQEGKRRLSFELDVLPEGFPDLFRSQFQAGFRTRDRFVSLTGENASIEQGSVIPPAPEFEHAQSPTIELNFERINQLKSESEVLAEEFADLDADTGTSEDHETTNTPPNTSHEPVLSTSGSSDTEKDEGVLTDSEIILLQRFDEDGVLAVRDAQAYLREQGKMAGGFIDGINQKLLGILEDTLIEQDGDDYVIYEDYLDTVNRLLKGRGVNERS